MFRQNPSTTHADAASDKSRASAYSLKSYFLHRLKTSLCVALCLTSLTSASLAETNAVPMPALSSADYASKYAAITKQILLHAIALERTSLEYRKAGVRRPLFNKLVFFGTQEAGAAAGLGFEITANQQFNRARRRLVDLDIDTLGNGLRAAEVGSIVAASGSGYMLSANFAKYIRARIQHKDTKSTDKTVRSSLDKIDALLAERQALVDSNPDKPNHARALVEGKILYALRKCFVEEYSQFSANTRSSAAAENLFFLLNASYNIVGAVAADVGFTSLTKPRLNGPSNILFTISGAMAAVSPLICAAELKLHRKFLLNAQRRKFGSDHPDVEELPALRKQLEALSAEQEKNASSPYTERIAIYTQSSNLFHTQLESEVKTMQRLNKVALQNSIAGPIIGSLLMTQGILGTQGYYEYFPNRLRKQFDLDYKGSVCGTVGTSLALVGNASWLVASLVYEHHLHKQKRLPEQLINARLEHLRQLETYVETL